MPTAGLWPCRVPAVRYFHEQIRVALGLALSVRHIDLTSHLDVAPFLRAYARCLGRSRME